MSVIVVVGARPNFIKIAPLMPALASAGIDASVAHTGQHYDALMSDAFFADLAIPEPKWLLGVGSGTHAVQTGTAMIRLEELFSQERPTAVIAVGDVNSTLAAALAASKLCIPIVHLEAGLRSFDMLMPEEVNRLVVDRLATLLLTPTALAGDNLQHEGVDASQIRFVGNIMAQSLLSNLDSALSREAHRPHGLEEKGYVLATIHRPENTDDQAHLLAIMQALNDLDLPVLFPAHPRTVARLAEMGDFPNIRAVDPVGYLDMLCLESNAALCVTDSGGVQEETCLVGTPCVTVRRNTERQVTVEIGANRLSAADTSSITAAVREALAAPRNWAIPERWDTEVSSRCVEAILERNLS